MRCPETRIVELQNILKNKVGSRSRLKIKRNNITRQLTVANVHDKEKRRLVIHNSQSKVRDDSCQSISILPWIPNVAANPQYQIVNLMLKENSYRCLRYLLPNLGHVHFHQPNRRTNAHVSAFHYPTRIYKITMRNTNCIRKLKKPATRIFSFKHSIQLVAKKTHIERTIQIEQRNHSSDE